jgi:hypothetical protein
LKSELKTGGFMPKDSFIFYRSYFNAIETLPVEQQQKLYRAIAVMSLNDKIVKISGMAKGIFTAIQPQINANKKRYENGLKGKEYGVKGKEYGVLGGRPRKGINPSGKNPSEKNPPENPPKSPPNENVNNNENVNENENVNVNENENENAAGADGGMSLTANESKSKEGMRASRTKVDFGAVIEDYNRVCTSLPAVKCLTDARRTEIKARSGEHGLGQIHEVFVKAEKSDFLCGRVHLVPGRSSSGRNSNENPWRASFDWLLNKANFVKVLEGNYDPKPREPSDLDDVF